MRYTYKEVHGKVILVALNSQCTLLIRDREAYANGCVEGDLEDWQTTEQPRCNTAFFKLAYQISPTIFNAMLASEFRQLYLYTGCLVRVLVRGSYVPYFTG